MTQLITLKSTIDVKLIDKMGSDQRIVEAMLVSTKGLNAEEAAQGSIEGRINFLMKKRHGTPFECSAITFLVHAPIKVWREWHRHRIGFSYNEESGRYKQLEPVFWLPPPERPMIKADNWKPSAPVFRVATPEEYGRISQRLMVGYNHAYNLYQESLDDGVDPGLARDVLGVGIFSACYVTCNVRSMMSFLELRTKFEDAKRPSSPLWEIAEAARQVELLFAEHWPVTYKSWVCNGRMAP